MHRPAGGPAGRCQRLGGCPLAIDSTSTEVKGLACLHWEWDTNEQAVPAWHDPWPGHLGCSDGSRGVSGCCPGNFRPQEGAVFKSLHILKSSRKLVKMQPQAPTLRLTAGVISSGAILTPAQALPEG